VGRTHTHTHTLTARQEHPNLYNKADRSLITTTCPIAHSCCASQRLPPSRLGQVRSASAILSLLAICFPFLWPPSSIHPSFGSPIRPPLRTDPSVRRHHVLSWRSPLPLFSLDGVGGCCRNVMHCVLCSMCVGIFSPLIGERGRSGVGRAQHPRWM